MKPLKPLAPIRPIELMRPLEPLRPMEPMPLEPMRPMEPLEPMEPMRPMDRPMDQVRHNAKAPMLWKWRLAPEINPMQYCQYKESCRLQLHVSKHLNPFHPAYMHKKWCRKIDANRQWHGPPPSPPQRELSPYAWWVSSRSSPFTVSRHHHHHQHHHHHRRRRHHHHHHHHLPHHHHHSTWNSDFSTSIFQVPNGAMKVTGSSIHRYRKSSAEKGPVACRLSHWVIPRIPCDTPTFRVTLSQV